MSLLHSIFKKRKEASGQITVLDREAYKAAISKNNVKPVDVRTVFEFNSGHIENAINVDFFNPVNFKKYFEQLDRDKAVYLYCRSGARSQKAARKLLNMGFSQIYDLKGGYLSWA